MMDLTENLYRHVAQDVLGTTTITYNGVEMDLGKPFERQCIEMSLKWPCGRSPRIAYEHGSLYLQESLAIQISSDRA